MRTCAQLRARGEPSSAVAAARPTGPDRARPRLPTARHPPRTTRDRAAGRHRRRRERRRAPGAEPQPARAVVVPRDHRHGGARGAERVQPLVEEKDRVLARHGTVVHVTSDDDDVHIVLHHQAAEPAKERLAGRAQAARARTAARCANRSYAGSSSGRPDASRAARRAAPRTRTGSCHAENADGVVPLLDHRARL